MNTLARSNKRTEVLFVVTSHSPFSTATTYSDKIYGGGFGAYCKMVDRATIALLGVPSMKCAVTFDGPTNTGKFTNLTTGEFVSFNYLEVK
jgi:hypothetical protein